MLLIKLTPRPNPPARRACVPTLTHCEQHRETRRLHRCCHARGRTMRATPTRTPLREGLRLCCNRIQVPDRRGRHLERGGRSLVTRSGPRDPWLAGRRSNERRREVERTLHNPNSDNTPPPLPVSVHLFLIAVGLVCTSFHHCTSARLSRRDGREEGDVRYEGKRLISTLPHPSLLNPTFHSSRYTSKLFSEVRSL